MSSFLPRDKFWKNKTPTNCYPALQIYVNVMPVEQDHVLLSQQTLALICHGTSSPGHVEQFILTGRYTVIFEVHWSLSYNGTLEEEET